MTINPSAPLGKSRKYAIAERERRFLLRGLPADRLIVRTVHIIDRYLLGTRLRLRQVVEVGNEAPGVVFRDRPWRVMETVVATKVVPRLASPASGRHTGQLGPPRGSAVV